MPTNTIREASQTGITRRQALKRGLAVDLAHTPELNEYHGSVGLQLRLTAVRKAAGEA